MTELPPTSVPDYGNGLDPWHVGGPEGTQIFAADGRSVAYVPEPADAVRAVAAVNGPFPEALPAGTHQAALVVRIAAADQGGVKGAELDMRLDAGGADVEPAVRLLEHAVAALREERSLAPCQCSPEVVELGDPDELPGGQVAVIRVMTSGAAADGTAPLMTSVSVLESLPKPALGRLLLQVADALISGEGMVTL